MLNEWADLKMGDPWPTQFKPVKAANKTLSAAPGDPADQYVALWYMHGEPVMGRLWNDKGKVRKTFFRASAFLNTYSHFKVAAAFGWGGNAYTDKIGSIQVLSELPDQVRGFDYFWRPFKEAAIFDKNRKEYFPVHVDSVKGNFFFSN